MGRLEIACYALGVVFLVVGVTVAMSLATDAWRANQHVRGLWWSALAAILVLAGILVGTLPIAHKADAEINATNQNAGQQRAWITVRSVTLENNTIAEGSRPTVFVEFENTGRVPATDLRPFGIIGLAEYSPDKGGIPDFPMDFVLEARANRRPPPTSIIGVGTPNVLPLTLRDPLSKQDVTDLTSGTGRFIVVYGLVEYRSIGGGSLHPTTFGYRTSSGYNALVPLGNWNSVK